ncbi:MAG: DNA-3-methyladenine glycosylase [Deltaproteobacteria bacterium]|jgi:DNA-3-methyladenine glycosylase|nr:DNA-3-methyladenine glycosylase [Deltaproteobacteria bacterium]
MAFKKLDKSFYVREDTVKIAKELIGKYLLTDIGGGGITGGKIVETEAYLGAIDKASHGYGNRKTERNKNLYKEGGYAYVYFIYGMYYLFNVVTGIENNADAVLIRAVEPEIGLDIMLMRKERAKAGKSKLKNKTGKNKTAVGISRFTSGPGLLTIALGIDLRHNGIPVCENNNNIDNKKNKLDIWLEDRNINITAEDIIETPRIGVGYAAEHALLPYRFKLKGNNWVSR